MRVSTFSVTFGLCSAIYPCRLVRPIDPFPLPPCPLVPLAAVAAVFCLFVSVAEEAGGVLSPFLLPGLYLKS